MALRPQPHRGLPALLALALALALAGPAQAAPPWLVGADASEERCGNISGINPERMPISGINACERIGRSGGVGISVY